MHSFPLLLLLISPLFQQLENKLTNLKTHACLFVLFPVNNNYSSKKFTPFIQGMVRGSFKTKEKIVDKTEELIFLLTLHHICQDQHSRSHQSVERTRGLQDAGMLEWGSGNYYKTDALKHHLLPHHFSNFFLLCSSQLLQSVYTSVELPELQSSVQ